MTPRVRFNLDHRPRPTVKYCRPLTAVLQKDAWLSINKLRCTDGGRTSIGKHYSGTDSSKAGQLTGGRGHFLQVRQNRREVNGEARTAGPLITPQLQSTRYAQTMKSALTLSQSSKNMSGMPVPACRGLREAAQRGM